MRDHFKISDISERINYKRKKQSFSFDAPTRNREEHGRRLERIFSHLWAEGKRNNDIRRAQSLPFLDGIYLEVLGEDEYQLPIGGLEARSKGIKIMNVRKVGNTEKTLLYIPKDKSPWFLTKINEYSQEIKKHDVINWISDITTAMLHSFWVGQEDSIPFEDKVYCELWVDNDYKNSQSKQSIFEKLSTLNIDYSVDTIDFVSRTVIGIKSNRNDLESIIKSIDYVAEIRRKSSDLDFFNNLSLSDEYSWVDSMLTQVVHNNSNGIYASVLDTGINNEHPLLRRYIDESSMITIHKNELLSDSQGHGTQMAGVVLYDKLEDLLTGDRTSYEINSDLESAKIISPRIQNSSELYGHVTSRAISQLEINHPGRNRVFCMAVTSTNAYDPKNGIPSSWSAKVDDLVNEDSKIFLVSAGNNRDFSNHDLYPNFYNQVQNPAQSWNAITVGATTDKEVVDDQGNTITLAKKNQISPHSTTSLDFDRKWPIKPEVVFEGGNLELSDGYYLGSPRTEALTTFNDISRNLFCSFNATSLATAFATNFTVKLKHRYPHFWNESIRALMIHSANPKSEYSMQIFNKNLNELTKTEKGKLLRIFGYGTPSLDTALNTVNNRVAMVVENTLKPFKKIVDGSVKYNEMHLYELPWPKEELKRLGNQKVTLKITLSFFIEPSPGEIGWKDKYKYPSAQLNFDLNGGLSRNDFISKINANYEYEQDDIEVNDEEDGINWFYGKNQRNVGSIRSDFWIGNAEDLADSNIVAVYPVSGWWKTRPHLKRFDNEVRYSLIISIETDQEEVDLITEIETIVSHPLEIEI